jgi:hypothetical protein
MGNFCKKLNLKDFLNPPCRVPKNTVRLLQDEGACGSIVGEETSSQGAAMIDSLSSEELQFIKAIEKYKSENNKHFLSWTEVLKIVKELGYKKVSKKGTTTPQTASVPKK